MYAEWEGPRGATSGGYVYALTNKAILTGRSFYVQRTFERASKACCYSPDRELFPHCCLAVHRMNHLAQLGTARLMPSA